MTDELDSSVGVLAVQGDVGEHLESFNHIESVKAVAVKHAGEFQGLDALVLPGGESTTMSKLMAKYDLIDAVRGFAESGKPVLGTCAGMVLLAREGGSVSEKTGQFFLGLIDARVNRNAFGPQRESFQTDLDVKYLEGKAYNGVFIRAPAYMQASPEVEVLAVLEGKIVAARQGNVYATAFHPELSGDLGFHELFLEKLLTN